MAKGGKTMNQRLHVWALTLSLGIVSAIFMLFFGWMGALGWGTEMIKSFTNFYIGFEPTFIGGIIGAVWGFVEGAITGWLIAVIYNIFMCKTKSQKHDV
jgi:hypothetical protein